MNTNVTHDQAMDNPMAAPSVSPKIARHARSVRKYSGGWATPSTVVQIFHHGCRPARLVHGGTCRINSSCGYTPNGEPRPVLTARIHTSSIDGGSLICTSGGKAMMPGYTGDVGARRMPSKPIATPHKMMSNRRSITHCRGREGTRW